MERGPRGNFKATAVEFPGVVSYGDSAEEAQAALEAAILRHLAATSSVALEAVHEEPLGMVPYAGLSVKDDLYIATNLDAILVTGGGRKEDWKRLAVTQQTAEFAQVFEGEGAEDIFDPGEYTTQIHSLAVLHPPGGNATLCAGTNLKGLVYINDPQEGWRPAFSTGEERVHALAEFKGGLFAGTSPSGRIFRWNGGQAELVHQAAAIGITAMGVYRGALYAGTYPDGAIVSSADGELWEIVCRTQQKLVNHFHAGPDALYASCSDPAGGAIFRTPDGAAWERCFFSEADLNVYSVASFSGRLYAGTGDGGRLYASRDGVHWEMVVQSPEAALRVVVAHGGRLYVGCERRGIFYRSAGTEAPVPAIRDVQVSALTSSGAFIEWSTDIPCDASVQFGEAAVRDQTASNAAFSLKHRLRLDGLKAGTRYTFLITARTSEGTQATYLNDEGFTTPVLSVPALESATHPEEGRWYPSRRAEVIWPPIPGATRYVFKFSPRRITGLTEKDPVTEGAAASTVLDADGVWYCAVAGVDEAGNIGEFAARELKCDTEAAMPRVVSASHAAGDVWHSSPSMEVEASGEDAASGVEGFLFAIARPGEAWENLAFQRAPGAKWTLPRLPDGIWEIYVRMRDGAGNESEPTSLRVQIDTSPPLVSLDPVPEVAGAGEVTLEWQARDDRSGIARIRVQQRRESGAERTQWETIYEGKGSAVKATGRDGWRVWYRVLAEDRAGLQAAAETHHAVLFDGSPPEPVTMVETWSLSGGDIMVKWAAVEDRYSGVARYEVYRGSAADRLGMKVASVPANVQEYVDEGAGLAHGGRYFYRIGSVDGVGNIQTDGATVTGICDKEAPAPALRSPTHPLDEWTTLTDATLEWDAPEDDTGVTEYLWRLDRNPASSLVKGVDASLAAPPLSISHLLDGLWYIHVSSVDGAGNVSPAAHYPLRVVTRPPHARVKLLPSMVNSRKVKLEWEKEDGVVAVAIGVREGGSQVWETVVERAEGTGREVETAGEGVFEFSVRAVDTYGRWGIWEEGQVTLVDTTPPLEIPVVEARAIAGGSIRIDWDPSWDELSGLASYRVYRSLPDGSRREKIAEVGGTEDTFWIDPCEGVEEGTLFVYSVLPVDMAGNVQEAGPTMEAICDRSAPTPVLSSPTHPDPAKAYSSRKLEVAWETEADHTGIEGVVVELNATPATVPNPDTLPIRPDRTMTFSLPEDGRWFLHVRAVDGAGNASETARLSVRVDTQVDPPAVAFAQDPFLEWQQTGAVTVGVKPPDDPSGVPACWCVLDQAADTVPDRTNATRYTGASWKIKPESEGDWHLHVVAEDGAGNLSAPVHLSMRLVTGLSLPRITRSSHPEGIWSQTREVEVEWEKAEGKAAYLYWLAHERQEAPPADAIRLNRPACRVTIEEGAWFLHVCAADEQGRKSGIVVYQVRVDATPPALSVYSPSHPQGQWSSKRRVQYAIEVEDSHSGIARVEIALTPSAEEPSIWELALGTEGEREIPGEGLWTIWARAVDLAGNISPVASWPIQVGLAASPPGINSATHPPDQWSSSKEAELFLQPGENLAGVSEYLVYLAGTGEEIPAAPPDDALAFREETAVVPVPGDGRYTLAAWVRDGTGNVSPPARYPILVDTTAAPPTGFVIEPRGEGGWIRSPEVQIFWRPPEEISGEPQGYLYVLDRSAATVPDPASAGLAAQPSLDLGGLDDGINYLHVRTLDAAGNLSAETVHVKLAVDGNPPSLKLASPQAGAGWTRKRTVIISAQGDDKVSGFVGCFWTLNREGEKPPPISSGRWKEEPSWSVEVPGDGAWVVTVAAMDGAGNLSDPQQLVVKVDAKAAPPGQLKSPSHPDAAAWYPSREVELAWTEPEEVSGVKAYRYAVGASPAALGTSDKWKTVTKPSVKVRVPEDGKWLAAVTTEDGAGNVSSPVTLAFLVDSVVTPPELSSPTHPRSTVWYSEGAVRVKVGGEDSASGLKEILVGVTGSEMLEPEKLKPAEGDTLAFDLERGTWWVHAVAVDNAGNRSKPAALKIMIDPSLRPPAVSVESHPDPEKWYPDTNIRFRIVPPAGGEGRRYLAVLDEKPGTEPARENAKVVPAGESQLSADHSGEWHLHVGVAGDGGESAPSGVEAVHVRVRVDVTSPPAPVVRSPTHLPSPRRCPATRAVMEWDEPEDVAGIKGYSYVLTRQAMLGKKERRGATAERTVAFPNLEPGVWEFVVVATDNAGHDGAPGRYSIAVSEKQDLRVGVKSESWRIGSAGVDVLLRSGDNVVRRGKTDDSGDAWFKDMPYDAFTVSIGMGKNNPPLEFEGVALEEGEPFIQFEVTLAGCAWMLCRKVVRLWVPEMWLEGGSLEVLGERGLAISKHPLKDLPKRGPALEGPLPDDLLTGAIRLSGGPLDKLNWPILRFRRVPL